MHWLVGRPKGTVAVENKSGGSEKKLKIDISSDPAIPFLCKHSKELKVGTGTDIYTPIFIAVLFLIAKRQKQLKCPWTECIDKMRDIYTMG